ncbi:hypothetical protein P4193_02300 [Pseudomonas aeruginosa]|nr:hypothetical protein [Pseudomonas aeruginosa]
MSANTLTSQSASIAGQVNSNSAVTNYATINGTATIGSQVTYGTAAVYGETWFGGASQFDGNVVLKQGRSSPTSLAKIPRVESSASRRGIRLVPLFLVTITAGQSLAASMA